jgi:hypothetical protein
MSVSVKETMMTRAKGMRFIQPYEYLLMFFKPTEEDLCEELVNFITHTIERSSVTVLKNDFNQNSTFALSKVEHIGHINNLDSVICINIGNAQHLVRFGTQPVHPTKTKTIKTIKTIRELKELATQFNINGRSSMNKNELVVALSQYL